MAAVSQKDRLHRELQALTGFDDGKRSALRMTVHALIDLGIVTKLQCSWSECSQASRAFVHSSTKSDRPSKSGAPRKKQQAHDLVMSIDHIEQFAAGGSDRPENLRLVHLICNLQMGRQQGSPRWTQRGRDSVSQASRARWATPEYRAKMTQMSRDQAPKNREKWNARTPEERAEINAKVSAGLKRAWAERKAAAVREGEK